MAVGITTPIGRRAHPLLGRLWCAAAPDDPEALPALSTLTLLESRPEGALVEVAIASGRPHQIRIHAAALGVPLLGDPLYLPGGLARGEALPGEGGYRLHAHRLSLPLPQGRELQLEAPLPPPLRGAGDG
jgi:23S rRNA pseudouridine1911/1915/1917 synthase